MPVSTIATGRRIHFDDVGSGPPLLLLTGLSGSRRAWMPVIEQFSTKFRMIALDNRDAGESEPESEQYSISDLADDAAALLHDLEIDRALVLGHSMGGFIALHLALRHPCVVERLVLVGTAAFVGLVSAGTREDWVSDPVERRRQRMVHSYGPGFFERRPELLNAVATLDEGNRLSWEGYARQATAISMSHDVRQQLADLRIPTLVIHGDVDPLVPSSLGEHLARDIPGAQLRMYQNVGHFPQNEDRNRFIEDVVQFLSTLES